MADHARELGCATTSNGLKSLNSGSKGEPWTACCKLKNLRLYQQFFPCGGRCRRWSEATNIPSSGNERSESGFESCRPDHIQKVFEQVHRVAGEVGQQTPLSRSLAARFPGEEVEDPADRRFQPVGSAAREMERSRAYETPLIGTKRRFRLGKGNGA
jgi:hypothetical protein